MKKKWLPLEIFGLLCLSLSFCLAVDSSVPIQELLVKSEKVSAVEYETVSTVLIEGKTQPLTAPIMKVWQKGHFQKIMSPETASGAAPGFKGSTKITRPDGNYIYDAVKDRFIKTTGDAPTLQSIVDLAKNNRNRKLTIVGDRVLDGKKCTLINAMAGGSENTVNTNYWIWKDNGLTVRIESTTKKGPTVIKIQTENRNYVFGNIPDTLFDVPKEKIIDSSAPNPR